MLRKHGRAEEGEKWKEKGEDERFSSTEGRCGQELGIFNHRTVFKSDSATTMDAITLANPEIGEKDDEAVKKKNQKLNFRFWRVSPWWIWMDWWSWSSVFSAKKSVEPWYPMVLNAIGHYVEHHRTLRYNALLCWENTTPTLPAHQDSPRRDSPHGFCSCGGTIQGTRCLWNHYWCQQQPSLSWGDCPILLQLEV